MNKETFKQKLDIINKLSPNQVIEELEKMGVKFDNISTTSNMQYFKEGQTVYHHEFGEGIVTQITNEIDYPVIVKFKDGNEVSFSFDGRLYRDCLISLSQNPIPPIVNVPFEDELKVGDYVRTSLGNVGQITTQSSVFENSFLVIVKSDGIVGSITKNKLGLTKITEQEYYEKFFKKGDVVLYKDSDEDDNSWKIGYFIRYSYHDNKNRFFISNNPRNEISALPWNQCKLYKP